MVTAGIAMMVLALAALVMVLCTSTDVDQEKTEEPVAPERDGLPRYQTV
jgi:hypothetical protein